MNTKTQNRKGQIKISHSICELDIELSGLTREAELGPIDVVEQHAHDIIAKLQRTVAEAKRWNIDLTPFSVQISGINNALREIVRTIEERKRSSPWKRFCGKVRRCASAIFAKIASLPGLSGCLQILLVIIAAIFAP